MRSGRRMIPVVRFVLRWNMRSMLKCPHAMPTPDNKTRADGDRVPVPHTGLAMTVDSFQLFADRLRKHGVPFVIEPHLRFQVQYVDSFHSSYFFLSRVSSEVFCWLLAEWRRFCGGAFFPKVPTFLFAAANPRWARPLKPYTCASQSSTQAMVPGER